MRKLLIGIVFVLLLVIVAIAGFLLVPSPLQKWAVERGATMAIGRQVTFGDPFRLRAWPPLCDHRRRHPCRQCRLGQGRRARPDRRPRCQHRSPGVLAREPGRDRSADRDPAAARSRDRRGRAAELGLRGERDQGAAIRKSRPRPSRSRASCWARSGSRAASSRSTIVRASRTGAPRRSTSRSIRAAPTSRSRSTAG